MYIRDRYIDDKTAKRVLVGAAAAVVGVIVLSVSFGGRSTDKLDEETLAASDKLIDQLQENQSSSPGAVPEDPAHAVEGDGVGNKAIIPERSPPD